VSTSCGRRTSYLYQREWKNY